MLDATGKSARRSPQSVFNEAALRLASTGPMVGIDSGKLRAVLDGGVYAFKGIPCGTRAMRGSGVEAAAITREMTS